MNRSTREPVRASRLIAAGTAAIVAVGLVSAPNGANAAPCRAEPVLAIQLQTVELTSVSLPTTSLSSATKTPRADITLPQIQGAVTSIVLAAGVIALVPLWYAATPITLPVSVAISTFLYTWVSAIGWKIIVPGDPPAPLVALGLGLAGWAVGPVFVVSEALKSLGRYLNSLVSQPDPAAGSASASHAPRQVQRTKSGLAGSQRTAATSINADRTPTAHRSATTTSKVSTEKKRSGTANSARPARAKG
jgi:hypothetical protein